MKSIAKPCFTPTIRWLIAPAIFLCFLSLPGSKRKNDQPATANSNLKPVADNWVSPLSVVEPPHDTKRLLIVGGTKHDIGIGHLSDWNAANARGNSQNLCGNLKGKVLPIDVNNGSPHGIPSDNPFASSSNSKKEIYADGFRNSYRFSFDTGSNHDLYLGVAGQSLHEELDIVTNAGNYGWNVKEATACFNTDNDLAVRSTCPSTESLGKPLVDPVIQLTNTTNPSRGGKAPVMVGDNVYGGTAFHNCRDDMYLAYFHREEAGSRDPMQNFMLPNLLHQPYGRIKNKPWKIVPLILAITLKVSDRTFGRNLYNNNRCGEFHELSANCINWWQPNNNLFI